LNSRAVFYCPFQGTFVILHVILKNSITSNLNTQIMKKGFVFTLFVSILLSLAPVSRADEGMWLLHLISKLNQSDMEAMGMKLSAEDIYSVNRSSLKDAIVSFGGFCTGEIVSSQGLILTNHHCGYPAIVSSSTIENDYITNGFWAMSLKEEIPIKGLFVRFLVSMEDVTEEVTAGLSPELHDKDREAQIAERIDAINKTAKGDTHYRTEVKSMLHGNMYVLFVYEIFNDVRLVGAPPSSIGKFGGDTDNWMWPRHTGDFAMFRVYMSQDGRPAEYDENNIPYKSKHWLPISLDGYEEGDFSFIMGYPGSTSRYLSSFGVRTAYNDVNPAIVKIRRAKLDILSEDMKVDNAIRIRYASQYASIANYWKYFIGQNLGIKRLNVIERKEKEEAAYAAWVKENTATLGKEYHEALDNIQSAYNELPVYLLVNAYLRETMFRGGEIIPLALRFRGLYNELSKEETDTEKIKKITEDLQTITDKHFDGFVPETELKLLATMLDFYHQDIPEKFQPEYLKQMARKYKSDFVKFSLQIFKTSIFFHQDKCNAFLNNPKKSLLDKDPVFQLAQSAVDVQILVRNEKEEADRRLEKGMRVYLKGNMQMHPEKSFYPDANSSMRLTYGKTRGYEPADAVAYDFITYMEGIIEKEDPASDEFIVTDRLKQLYKSNDFGNYADKNGKMPVCFLTDHDITGGNSGSPVINGKGELIGIAFDGNWEAMSMDIAFEEPLQRTINVDIRYVLFIIDKYAGAKHLIDEMDVRKSSSF
jgi:hypothetical protein